MFPPTRHLALAKTTALLMKKRSRLLARVEWLASHTCPAGGHSDTVLGHKVIGDDRLEHLFWA